MMMALAGVGVDKMRDNKTIDWKTKLFSVWTKCA